jgi:hypothetical protein
MNKRKESEFLPDTPTPPAFRVRLDAASFVAERGLHWAEITLSYGDRYSTKRSACPDCELIEEKIRSVVEATLAAMEDLSGHVLGGDLVDYDVVRAFGGEYIVVLINLVIHGQEYHVFGRCQERDKLAAAAARATLDAANQHLRDVLKRADG